MCAYEVNFTIVEDHGCPMYVVDEIFKISGQQLTTPNYKPTCILLVRDLTEIILKDMDTTAGKGSRVEDDKKHNCCGCSGGFIRFLKGFGDQPRSLRMPSGVERFQMHQILDTIANMLNTFSFFQALDKESLKDLVASVSVESFEEDEIILEQNQAGKNLYIIVSGKVSIIGAEGESITQLGRGEIFGEMSLLTGRPVNATVRAVEPLKALVLSNKDLAALLFKHPRLQSNLSRLILQRLSTTTQMQAEKFVSGIAGNLKEISASELFQMFHENAKTGRIDLNLAKGDACIIFVNGEIVTADYGGLTGVEAFFDILREQEGRFRFTAALPQEELEKDPIGPFMRILMEGLRVIDEEKAAPEDFVE